MAVALLAATALTPLAPARAAPGDALGSEFQVHSFTKSFQFEPAVAMDADGDFVVAWVAYGQDGDGWGIFALRYDAAGMALGPEVRVNTFTTGQQLKPAVAMDADGDYTVAWTSYGQIGVNYGVYAQRFQGAGPVAEDFTVDGRTDILWRNTDTGNTNLWQMDGFVTDAVGGLGRVPLVWEVQ